MKTQILSVLQSAPVREGAKVLNRLLSRKRPHPVGIGSFVVYARTFDRILALHLLKWKLNERAEVDFFQRLIAPGMCVVDVGANLGYYTLLAAKRVGPNGRVFAFEPDPENHSLLAQSIQANGFNNVVLSDKAVSDVSGRGTLFFSEEHRGDHRIFDPGDGRKRIEVSTVRLDDAIPEDVSIDVIKMDIQGAEMKAMEGTKRILDRNPQIKILCEFWPLGLSLSGCSGEEFLSLFSARGFTYSYLGKRGQLRSATPEQLVQMCGKTGYINLYIRI